jgi:acyl transferase domain-containing protein
MPAPCHLLGGPALARLTCRCVDGLRPRRDQAGGLPGRPLLPSTGARTLTQAHAELAAGRLDWALVGGASGLLRPHHSLAFARLGMLSPGGACRAFDAAADGYARAEGVAVVVLRRRPAQRPAQRAEAGPAAPHPALRAGDPGPRAAPTLPPTLPIFWAARPPYAAVLGAGVNNDGHTRAGITFPSAAAQAALAAAVCAAAAVRPAEVAYVEAHGTGTAAGDAQELAALDAVYGAGAGRGPGSPLLIGSVKSNMGHAEGCSGLAGLIKLLLGGEAGALPGNLHYAAPNPASAGLAAGTLRVVAAPVAWPGGIAAVSSFGFGGSNAHVLLRCGRGAAHARPAAPTSRDETLGSSPEPALARRLPCALPCEPAAGMAAVGEPELQVNPSTRGAAETAAGLEPGPGLHEALPLAARTQEGLTRLAAAVTRAGAGRLLVARPRILI